jgi:hypothetical protein
MPIVSVRIAVVHALSIQLLQRSEIIGLLISMLNFFSFPLLLSCGYGSIGCRGIVDSFISAGLGSVFSNASAKRISGSLSSFLSSYLL